MPLQDRQDFKQWIAQRRQRETAVHGEPPDDGACAQCGQSADEQKIIDGYCIECLAFDYGAEHTARRIARAAQAIATTLLRSDPHASIRLVHAIIDRLDDALDDTPHDRVE